ncbi:MFS transporter [Streptomyces sp. NPDC006285]|uniref:MFS transporter n=1 Tax=Streptomyces sp. NPDC006285 TaxID=3364742 RepID=UPI0036879409
MARIAPTRSGDRKYDDDAIPPLRRNRGFQLLWSGSVAFSLGAEVTEIALPLLVLAVAASPVWVGLFSAIQLLAAFLCGLLAGQVSDRADPRTVLLYAEGIRAVVILGVSVLAYVEKVSVAALLLAAAVLGATMPFSVAPRMLLLRALVHPSQLTTALTQDEVRSHGAGLAGPPMGGFLYGVSAAVSLLCAGVLSLLSWVSTLLIRPTRVEQATGEDRSGPAGNTTGDRSVFAGIKALWGQPTLRAAALLVTALNVVGAPLVLISVVMLREQSVSPGLIGVAMTGLAAGGLAGAALVKPLHARFRPGGILLGVAVVQVPVLAALSLELGPWWVAGVLFCAMLGIPVLRVLVDVLIFRQVPDAQRGRTIAAVMTLFTVGAPIGMLLAGLLLEYAPPGTAMLALAALCALGALYAFSRRELRQATWPAGTGC